MITHYIYCPRAHAHWPDLGGVFGALVFSEISIKDRRKIISEHVAEGRQIRTCLNGPYQSIQLIYRAVKDGISP
jgi:hypothetical protein